MQYNKTSKMECQCCYEEFGLSKLLFCNSRDTHFFCIICIEKHFKTLIGVRDLSLSCISTDGCKGSFEENDIRLRLSKDLCVYYDKIKSEKEVQAAKIGTMVYCPFCNTATIQDQSENELVVYCANRLCGITSCIKCFKEHKRNHECKSKVRDRTAKEEALTYANIKMCPSCKVDVEKTIGCNHITCPCGTHFCYSCGLDITGRVEHHDCSVPNALQDFQQEFQDYMTLGSSTDAYRTMLESVHNTYQPYDGSFRSMRDYVYSQAQYLRDHSYSDYSYPDDYSGYYRDYNQLHDLRNKINLGVRYVQPVVEPRPTNRHRHRHRSSRSNTPLY